MSYFKVKMPEAYARVKWCRETFGPSFGGVQPEERRWQNMRWYRNKGRLYFKDKEDYLIYILRWGHEG